MRWGSEGQSYKGSENVLLHVFTEPCNSDLESKLCKLTKKASVFVWRLHVVTFAKRRKPCCLHNWLNLWCIFVSTGCVQGAGVTFFSGYTNTFLCSDACGPRSKFSPFSETLFVVIASNDCCLPDLVCSPFSWKKFQKPDQQCPGTKAAWGNQIKWFLSVLCGWTEIHLCCKNNKVCNSPSSLGLLKLKGSTHLYNPFAAVHAFHVRLWICHLSSEYPWVSCSSLSLSSVDICKFLFCGGLVSFQPTLRLHWNPQRNKFHCLSAWSSQIPKRCSRTVFPLNCHTIDWIF